jgi:hypothetical protein
MVWTKSAAMPKSWAVDAAAWWRDFLADAEILPSPLKFSSGEGSHAKILGRRNSQGPDEEVFFTKTRPLFKSSFQHTFFPCNSYTTIHTF